MDENVPDWLAKAAEETDALVQQVMPVVRAAQRYVEEARAAQTAAGPPLLSARDLALVMDAGMRELFTAVSQQWDALFATSPPEITSTGSIAVPAMGATGTESPADVGMPLDAKTVFLAILWVFALLLPMKIGLLSPDVQAIIRDYLVTVGLALTIHWRVQDGRRR